jgi:DNA-binding transcriptional LysR family regulator
MIFNQSAHILNAALQGYGIAYLPEEQIKHYVAQGQLIQLLEPWCPTFPGYHLYFPSRRQSSPAFSLVVDTLRYRT